MDPLFHLGTWYKKMIMGVFAQMAASLEPYSFGYPHRHRTPCLVWPLFSYCGNRESCTVTLGVGLGPQNNCEAGNT